MQGCGNFFDRRVLRHHQMKSPRDEVDMRIDLRGFGDDVLNARMRTANHQHDAVGRLPALSVKSWRSSIVARTRPWHP
jgi:hypothetical protein